MGVQVDKISGKPVLHDHDALDVYLSSGVTVEAAIASGLVPDTWKADIAAIRAIVSTTIDNGDDVGNFATAYVYQYDSTSVVADNGDTVLKPTDIVHPAPGRWVKQFVLVDTALTQTLSGKTLKSAAGTALIVDSVTTTKGLVVSLVGMAANKTSTLTFQNSLDRNYSFPDVAGTIVLDSAAGVTTHIPYYSAANLLTSSANFTFDGTNVKLLTDKGIYFGTTNETLIYYTAGECQFTTSGGLLLSTVKTNIETNQYGATIVNDTSIKAATTVATYYGLQIDASQITLNAGSVLTTTATVYIGGAPTNGTTPYSLLIGSGNSKFIGDLSLGAAGTTGSAWLYNTDGRYLKFVPGGTADMIINYPTAAPLGASQTLITSGIGSPVTYTWGYVPVGTGVSTQLTYWSGTSTVTGNTALTYNGTTLTIGVNGVGGVAGSITLCDGANPGTTETLTYAKWNSLNDANGIVKCNGSGTFSAATAGTDYIAGGTGANTYVTYFTAAGTVTGSTNFTWDLTTLQVIKSEAASSTSGANLSINFDNTTLPTTTNYRLGGLRFYANTGIAGGDTNTLVASIMAGADGTWTEDTNCGTSLIFSTAATVAGTNLERFRINSTGNTVLPRNKSYSWAETGTSSADADIYYDLATDSIQFAIY